LWLYFLLRIWAHAELKKSILCREGIAYMCIGRRGWNGLGKVERAVIEENIESLVHTFFEGAMGKHSVQSRKIEGL
jgi:hypothetical protein